MKIQLKNSVKHSVLILSVSLFFGCSLKPLLVSDELRAKQKTISFHIPDATISTSFDNERVAQAMGGLIGLGIAAAANKWRQDLIMNAGRNLSLRSNFQISLSPAFSEKYKFQPVNFADDAAVTNTKLFKFIDGKQYGRVPAIKNKEAMSAEYLGYLKMDLMALTSSGENYSSIIGTRLYVIEKASGKVVFYKSATSTRPLSVGPMDLKTKTALFTGDNTATWQKVVDEQIVELAAQLTTDEVAKK